MFKNNKIQCSVCETELMEIKDVEKFRQNPTLDIDDVIITNGILSDKMVLCPNNCKNAGGYYRIF